MFTFDAMPVKFVGLLVLFVWCTLWCLYELTRPQDARQRVSNALHLAMAVVMLAMVPTVPWQMLVAVVSMPVLIGLFALATLWFGWRLIESRTATRGVRGHFAGHAAMFAAMTWHLSAMAMMRAHMGPGMAQWMADASRVGGALWVFALVGVPFMGYLLLAGLNDVRRAMLAPVASVSCACGDDCACGPGCACDHAVPASLEVREHAGAARGIEAGVGTRPGGSTRTAPAALAATCHEPRPVGSASYRLSALADAAMNLGMFWMSTGLLVGLLPVMRLFSF